MSSLIPPQSRRSWKAGSRLTLAVLGRVPSPREEGGGRDYSDWFKTLSRDSIAEREWWVRSKLRTVTTRGK